jgi:hypothetical protein
MNTAAFFDERRDVQILQVRLADAPQARRIAATERCTRLSNYRWRQDIQEGLQSGSAGELDLQAIKCRGRERLAARKQR